MNYRLILKSRKTNSKTNEAPKEYTCQFWEPGLVSYEDSGAGKALLRKESMDKILPSFVGKPVTIDHVEGSPDEIMNAGRAVGTVTNAYWNPDTGWYECKFTVENEDARKKVESGWSVSCAFDVSEQTGPGGEHHAIPYDEEITSGTFTHLALVRENPRYEDSKIFKNHKMRLNAKGVKMNKKYAVGDRVEYRGTIGTVTGYSGEIVVIDYDKGGSAHVAENNPDLKMRGDLTPFEGSKENAKTVLISIPYRLLERDDDKNPDQELQAKGLRNVGGGGGVADFEFTGTEQQAAAIVKSVLGTVSGVDIGMMNSKKNGAGEKYEREIEALQDQLRTETMSPAEAVKIANQIKKLRRELDEYAASKKNAVDTKAAVAYIEAELRRDETISESAMIAKVQAHFPINEEAAEDLVGEAMGFGGKRKYTPRENDASDFGTILREIKEQLYQMAQSLAGKFNGKAGVFKKGESVRDHEGQWCTIVGEAESGDYYVVKYADGSTDRMREGDLNNSKENAGEPYSVSIEHKPEERGGDVYRVVLIKDGKEADHILVKGDAAAQEQKKKWLKQYNSKQNDAFGENIIRVKFRTKRGSTEEKYTTVEEFSSDANARLRASALNWDILSIEPIKKNSRVILKPGKSNSTQEKKPMFGLFKRKSKKNDQEAAPAKLPLEQIDVEIDGVAVPLSELVTGFKAEQAEVAEKQKLEQAQAAKEVTEAPAPEANADNTAPEDLNLENQEFSVEDGSRFNMTELVDSYNRRKAAKCNAEKEKEKDDYLNALDFGDGKSEAEARAKLKEMGWSDAEIEETIKTKKEGQAAADAAKKNASETPEEKAAKENAKKDPKYFHKLNDLKNAGEVLTGKAMETLSDKIERGNARYGSKKK